MRRNSKIKDHIIRCDANAHGHSRIKKLIEELIKNEALKPSYRYLEYFISIKGTPRNPYNAGLYSLKENPKNIGLRNVRGQV